MRKKKPALTFLFPNFLNGNLDYHLGANHIIAFLRHKGVYADQFVIKRPASISELAGLILDRHPGMIGFTCFHTNYYLVKSLSQQIKIRRPDILIIAGGPTATFSDKELLKDLPQIDICVRGEGEHTTFELMEHLKNNKGLDDIEGVTYRKNGNIIRNQDRHFIVDIDTIPSPYLTGILKPEDLLAQNGHITILTSRGCVYKCVYCNFSIMSKHTVRYHSIDRIISELKVIGRLEKTGKEFRVGIMDDTFTFDRKRAKELCERIIKEGIALDFWTETRGDCLDKKLLKLLFEAGITELNLGLESSVPKILYAMKKVRRSYTKKKGFIPEKRYIQSVKDNVELAKKIGIKIGVNIIFGFPGETLKDGLRTLDFVSRLKADRFSYNYLRVCPGTELFEAIFNKEQHALSFYKKPLLQGFTYSEYDLNRLPALNDRISTILRSHFISLFLVNVSMGSAEKAMGNHPECVILTGDALPLGWLEKNIVLQTKIMFGKNIHRLIDHGNGAIKITAKSFAEILSLISTEHESAFVKLDTNSGYPGNKYSFIKLAEFSRLSNKISGGTGVIFDIHNNEDIHELEKEAESAEDSGIFGTHGKPSLEHIILDACRWSSNCPASQMKRLIIDDNGNIRCCFNGEATGHIDTPLEKIQKNITSLLEKTKLKRGCDFCPAKDRCSKCFSLGAITQDEYCGIMKGNASVSNFVNSLRAAMTMECVTDILKDKI